jgi:hypothetical protein
MSDQIANAAVLNEVNNEVNASSQIEESRRTNQKDEQHGVTTVEPTNTDKDEQQGEQHSEITKSINTSLITPPAGFVEGEVTPPLPNGQKRLHPLFDEDKIVSEAVARQENVESSTKNGGDPNKKSTEKERPNALRLLDSLGNEAGYPSPSGGFVPPITDENWALQQPPVPRSADGKNSRSIQNDEMNKGILPQSSSNHFNSLSSQTKESSSTASVSDKNEASSSNPTNNNDETINRLSLTGNKLSSSQSSASGGVYDSGVIATHSQAISARSSPSILAPIRRRSSASADVLNMSAMTPQGEGSDLAPLKIRDFAYEEVDPRHVGARDVGLPSPERKHTSGFGMSPFGGGPNLGGHEWGSTEEEYDDEDEEEEEDQEGYGNESTGDTSSSSIKLPPGLYHAAYDFVAESDHELNVKVGQRVRLIGHVDGGWGIVVRVKDGEDDVAADEEETEKGLVPQAYLEWLGP